MARVWLHGNQDPIGSRTEWELKRPDLLGVLCLSAYGVAKVANLHGTG
jgi:hypothetical protein